MAGSRTYRTKVLVLDKTKLKETDLILTMLDERGRSSCRGKRPQTRRRLGGALRAVLHRRYAACAWTVARRGFPGRAYGGAARRCSRLRDDMRRKRDRRGRARVLVRGRRGPVYLCHHAAGAHTCRSGLDAAHMDLLVAAFVFKLLSHVATAPISRHASRAAIPCSRISRPRPAGFCAGRAPRACLAPSWYRSARSHGCAL